MVGAQTWITVILNGLPWKQTEIISISPSSEYSGFISFRIDWFDLIAVQGTLKSLLQHHSLKASILWRSAFFMVQLLRLYMTIGKTIALNIQTFAGEVLSFFCLGLIRCDFGNSIKKKNLCLELFCLIWTHDRTDHLNTFFIKMAMIFFLNQPADIYHWKYRKKVYLLCQEQIPRALCKGG